MAGAAGGEENHGTYMTDGIVANKALSGFVQRRRGRGDAAQSVE